MNTTDLTFTEETKEGISVIDFWAPWCAPCRTISPIIEELTTKYAEEGIKVLKANVDECPDTAKTFSIRSIPTIVVLNNGVEIARGSGSVNVAQSIEEMVAKAKV